MNGARVERAILRERDVVTIGRVHLFVTAPLMTPAGAPKDWDPPSSGDADHVTLDPELDAQLGDVARIAPSEVPVLVLGETGTGKEVLARSVHRLSRRRGSFVAVNCGAIPAGLLESQLFGHVRGAFSGAVRDEPGLFRTADGGTLFLDEIGDLPPPSQVALLRALQEREIVPVGATRPVRVDLRVVAATHQPIEALAESGSFRRDLLARLSGFTFVLSPLRTRPWDVGILLASLLRKLALKPEAVRIAPDAGEMLLRHSWPLNTRELEQCLGRALALAQGEPIEASHLPPSLSAAKAPAARPSPGDDLSDRDQRLRLELLARLAAHHGNLAEVARDMGKARMQVHRWCKRFGIDPNLYRP